MYSEHSYAMNHCA